MPNYTYRVRRPEAAPAPELKIDRKVTRGPSTEKAAKVSRPSRAKTVENIPRKSSDE